MREKLKTDNIYGAVKYFDHQIDKRRDVLLANTQQLRDKMYAHHEYIWNIEYDGIMKL